MGRLGDLRRDRRGYGLPLFALVACAITVAAILGTQILSRMVDDGRLAAVMFPALRSAGADPDAPRFRNIDMTPIGSIERTRVDPCTGKTN